MAKIKGWTKVESRERDVIDVWRNDRSIDGDYNIGIKIAKRKNGFFVFYASSYKLFKTNIEAVRFAINYMRMNPNG